MNLNKLAALIFTLFFAGNLFAQRQISGTVTDAATSEPMIGVTVFLKSSPGIGTTTELDGSFQLSLPVGADNVLVFSFVGYKEQEVAVGTSSKFDVALEADAQQLGEVVVTALGIKRQKRELGYSTESVSGNDVVLATAPNLVSSLSGKSAGVQVTSPNGVEGGTTRIIIRGNNNISSNNEPLVVVDGVPIENAPGMTDVGRGVDWGSAINNINPNDIEDINILKGPTASALYGSRGANGVVLITTKRGRQQPGIGINYVMTHKVIQPFRYRDVQNTFGAGGPISLNEPTLPKTRMAFISTQPKNMPWTGLMGKLPRSFLAITQLACRGGLAWKGSRCAGGTASCAVSTRSRTTSSCFSTKETPRRTTSRFRAAARREPCACRSPAPTTMPSCRIANSTKRP
ncbi:MAG: TonB-dependent receptor plug domain-containing protein [Saprospiraceae bacterium]|nr:TonB-dependent receptor plug domain-containing protein [Saprospiraceae bacterium]